MKYNSPSVKITPLELTTILKASTTHNGDGSIDDNKDNNNPDIEVDSKKNLWTDETD